jgi:ATP-dependent Clp protease ATP-binding subunit ClpA
MYTLNEAIQPFKPAIKLEKLISRKKLGSLRAFSITSCLAGGTTAAFLYFFPEIGGEYGMYRNVAAGVSLLGITIWLDSFLATVYHNNYYFSAIRSAIDAEESNEITYEVAQTTLTNPDDVALAFVSSNFGQTILLRSGITLEQIQLYLKSPRLIITATMVTIPDGELFSLIGLGKYLLQNDVQFTTMLQTAGVQSDTYIGALRWVINTHHEEKHLTRWWSRDNLAQTKSLGRELTTGTAYLLQKFSKDIRTSAVFSMITRDRAYAGEKVTEIEQSLARQKAANVLLIGEAGVGKMDLIMELQRRAQTGQSLASLENEQFIVLDTNRLFAVCSDKQSLEQTILALVGEAMAAGHITIVIENLSAVITEASAVGVHLPELLDEFLAIPDLHIIATDTPAAYHSHLETLGGFVRRFTEIDIATPDNKATVQILQKIALRTERIHNLLFTYGSLTAVAAAADRYIVTGVMPDKAITLLETVATHARSNSIAVITADLVYTVTSQVTGVPAGPVGAEERDRLLNLEDQIHQLVIGQTKAVTAIATTMRRARTGMQAGDKPMGSFLFLGPTGVGKTETAKALATVFFGGEHTMQRLDMSEYSGDQALTQLIGDSEHPGALATLLREHPYCVLLLDEFEKASQSIHDLFLQILDEGVFTDGRGQQVNARNTIIIATSNAGSRLILETVQSRQTLTHLDQNIIDTIIADGTYRPELINRFDSTVLFEPLTIEEQASVAQLLLKELYKRIQSQGYQLQVDDSLITLLVEKGYHPEFGARPMQRVLQDVVEAKVADKILSGSLQKGDSIILSQTDFTEAELA